MPRTATLFARLLPLLLLPFVAWAHEPVKVGEFVENRGQWDARARYAGPIAAGAWLFAEKTGLTYALTGGLPNHEPKTADAAVPTTDLLPAHALRVAFVQPQPGVVPVGEGLAAGQRHYLRGNDAEKWAANAQAWQQLRYHELWPGIDFVLKTSVRQEFEYDLQLAAGADARQIRLRYRGAESLRLNAATGQLEVQTSVGKLTEYQPQAWQTDPATGRHQPVACRFQLRGNEVSFRLGHYDHNRPLVIDPVVQFVSYSGARVENWGFSATHDAAGNLYTAGLAFEPGYPATTGAYQTTFSGNVDMVVVKFNTAVAGAAARVWATYLGGSQIEFPHSLVVNGRGELLLLGSTSSTNYPTTARALGRVFQGGPAVAPYGTSVTFALPNGTDLVLTRLSASGGQLRASTYLGSSGNDGVLDANAPAPRLRHNYGDAIRGDLTLDAQGNVYIASVTGPPASTLPTVAFPGLVASSYQGQTDGLVASLDSSLSRVNWATVVGGSGADAAYSIQRDAGTGYLYVAGGTASTDLLGRAGGYQATYGGNVDGFVARLTPTGQLLQSTYLGTSSYDQSFFVRMGLGGKPCVLGQSLTNNWPNLDPLCYSNLFGHQFIQQLAPDLRSAGFATVFGSGRATTDISPTAFEVDCYGRMFAVGWGGGLDPSGGTTQGLATTSGAVQRSTDTQDFYLLQLSDQARTLEYATFFGSAADDHVDGGMSRFDPQGTLYQALCACNQSGLPLPPGANFYATTNVSPHCDNAAFKLSMAILTPTGAGPDTLSVCSRGAAVPLGGSPAGGTWSGAGIQGSSARGYVFVPDTTLIGTHVLTYTSPFLGLCAGTSTRRITVLPQGLARVITRPDSFCIRVGQPAPALVPLLGVPAGGTWSGPGVVHGTAVFNPSQANAGDNILTYTVPGGRCPAVASVRMLVKIIPPPTRAPRREVCANDAPFPLGGSPSGGTWTGAGVTGTSATGYYFNPSTALIGRHILLYIFTGQSYCEPITDTLRVVVRPVSRAVVTAPRDTAMCYAGAAPVRLRGGLPAGGSWSGPGVSGSRTAGYVFTPASLTQAGNYVLTYIGPVVDTTECPNSARRTITLNSSQVSVSIANTLLCTSSGPQRLQATPTGGTWTGPGVSGSPAAGYVFTPTAALYGYQTFTYTTAPSSNPAQCPAAGTVQVFVVQSPTVIFDPIPTIGLCQGVPPHGVVLGAQPAGGTFSGPGVVGNRFNPALVGLGAHPISYTYQPPGIVCPVVATLVINVVAVPPIQLPADTVLCAAQTPFKLNATPPGGTWSGPGVTAAGIFTPPAAAGTSIVTYTLPGDCGRAEYRITVPAQPTFSATWASTACATNLVAPRRLRFEALGPQAAQVRWDFGDGSNSGTGAVVEHSYASGGQYVPRAYLPDGTASGTACPRTVALPSVAVTEATLPNIITPNGDRQNDTFAPVLGGCPARLQVYSRWGQKVFEQADYAGTWDAAGLASGVYYYLLSGEGMKIRGWVEVVR